MISWPDRDTWSLPTRAYLRSVLDQTIPARRLALSDAIDHLREARASDDRGWADMAVLGVVAEAMQILEDLAYVGESFTVARFQGLPFYVSAITYSARIPTNFYRRKRSDDDLRVLLGYAVRDPSSSAVIGIVDNLVAGGLSDEARSAWRKAEDATTAAVGPALRELADVWDRFGKYFLAFKHGGLVANREDFQLVDDTGAVLDPALAVWMRRKAEPSVHGHAEAALGLDEVVEQLQESTWIAFDLLDMVIGTRLGFAEHAAAGPPERTDELMSLTVPARFRIGPTTLDDSERRALEDIGISFDDGALAQ